MSRETSEKYKNSVKKAKLLYKEIQKNQLAIAKLAYETCEIIVGGHQVGTRYSLTMFAEDAGINRKTLSDWVHNYEIHLIAKNKLKSKKLNPSKLNNQKDLNAIRLILRKQEGGLTQNKTPAKILDAYEKICERSDDARRIAALARSIKNLEYNICYHGAELEMVEQEDLAMIHEFSKNIKKALDQYFRVYEKPTVVLRKTNKFESRKNRESNLLDFRRSS